jgi:predicted transposase/invertase (TIGR01784 family)
MAMVVRAQLKSLEAKKKDSGEKYNIKWELFREFHRRKYGRKRTMTLLKFMDWIIRLPDDLEERLSEEIIKFEEEQKMPYIPTWERRAKKEGRMEGKIEGIEIGENNTKKRMARELLKRGVSLDIVAQSSGLSPEELKKLVDKQH